MVARSTLLSLFASALLSAVVADPTDSTPQLLPGAYIVEFEDGQDEPAFFNELESSSIPVTPRMSLSYSLFKGASFYLDNTTAEPETVATIASSPVVKKIWPVRVFELPKDEVVWTGKQGLETMPAAAGAQKRAADTFSPHLMTQVDKLHADGVTGKGIKIAVIDSGIDYLHPALGGGFGPGYLVSYGTDLSGDNYNGGNTPVPDNDPIDVCGGHGTHVAGIVAAQANPFGFTGAAPGVTIGAYRVFGCTGGAGNDILIAAYNQAYEAGSQIITASIGGASGWSEDPWAVAVQRIVEKGVPCLLSAGNSGSNGLMFASTASNGIGITSVASVDNTQAPSVLVAASYSGSNGTKSFGWAPGTPSNWGNVSLPLYSVNFNSNDPANSCDPYPDSTPDLSNKIVLIRRGTCTFVQKVTNAAAKGAKYIMFYNNQPGTAAVVAQVQGVQGVGMVSAVQGAEWINQLAAGQQVVLTITDPKTAGRTVSSEPNTKSGGFLSTFTSWGPTYEVDIKPQISSPGGLILSTYPRALGAYAVLSGTSMACPLAAGVTALIAQVRGTFNPREIENLLSAHANPQLFHDGTKAYSFLASVAQQGGGLIQAYDAAHSTTILSRSSISFNDTGNGFVERTNFKIRNTGKAKVTFQLGQVSSPTAYTLAAGSVYPKTFPNDFATTSSSSVASLSFNKDRVTIPAGGEMTVKVDLTLPKGLDAARLPVYSGYITLNSTDGQSLSLPYLGIAGSLQDAVVLSNGTISSSKAPTTQVPAGTTFTIVKNGTGTEYPIITPILALGSRRVLADLIPQDPKYPAKQSYPPWRDSLGVDTIGQAFGFPAEVLPRRDFSTSPPTDSQIVWDGRLADRTFVPEGAYTILVRALQIFGDQGRGADYDEWESPVFNVKYA